MFQAFYHVKIFNNWIITFGLDSYSYFLCLLTLFIFSLCFLMIQTSIFSHLRLFINLLIILEFLILLSFLTLDFFCFYFFFETSLIPMYLLIGFWGKNFRKVKAAYYLFLYTFTGSLFMLFSLLILFSFYGTTNYFVLLNQTLPIELELLMWPAIFFTFAVKIPMFPFHLWLPEAHVEAPTIGSVILAAIVLKLGGYGMVRFLFPLFPNGTLFYLPFGYTLAIISAIYAGLTALRQLDLKRIIAFSSIAHMNFGLLGLFSQQSEGISGFFLMMLGHGIISAALFFLVGVLYDRYHTRLISYYSGLVLRMPLFASFFFFFTLSNIAFPGTINFIAELLILLTLSKFSFFLLFLMILVLLIGTFYAFWLYNRLCFGTLKISNIYYFYDLTKKEFFLFSLLTFLTLCGGFCSNLLLNLI
jgi:proton-translocating NADH-quinone oxidoreductase chain M